MKRAAFVIGVILSMITLAFLMSIPVSAGIGYLTDGLVSCWDLDEASGTRYDAYGTNDLTDYNTVGQAAGVNGYAGSFISANSEYLAHSDNADLSTGNIDFTVMAWVYPTNISASGQWWLMH